MPRRLRSLLGLLLTAWAVLWAVQLAQNGADREAASVLAEQARPGDIVMYTTSDCPYCAKARAWLQAHEVSHTECNIERSPACRQAFEALRSAGVPTLVVKGRRQVGFDPQRLARAFEP
ncbi:glutaredoxin family protein [Eleftheria terrae]|uniref:glutaredoxin family protein n=1 Tax=Eleftheria terrae TaxID=1597781 RepID=UPI00263B49E2|nr:glutaredoxin family protein [Eleftheria terrae]WKB54240.1 glutaredoxin family protein [Eleftheria terrae]